LFTKEPNSYGLKFFIRSTKLIFSSCFISGIYTLLFAEFDDLDGAPGKVIIGS
jgi:hypothetical protein